MDFQALKTAYLATHWLSVDETARRHLDGFAAFCAAEFERVNAPAADPEPEAPVAELEPIAPPVVPEPEPEPEPEAPADPDPHEEPADPAEPTQGETEPTPQA